MGKFYIPRYHWELVKWFKEQYPEESLSRFKKKSYVELRGAYCRIMRRKMGISTKRALTLGIIGIILYSVVCPHPALAGQDNQLSDHFTHAEFKCKHCQKLIIDPVLIGRLEDLRAYIGNKPIIITSGYRCAEHNAAIKGAVKNSRHMRGQAADIRVLGLSHDELAVYAWEINFGYIKVYKTHVHVDVRR